MLNGSMIEVLMEISVGNRKKTEKLDEELFHRNDVFEEIEKLIYLGLQYLMMKEKRMTFQEVLPKTIKYHFTSDVT